MRVPSRLLLRLLAMALVVGTLGLAAVNLGQRLSVSGPDRLRALPEATLYYPGAVVLFGEGGTEASDTASTSAWKTLGTHAPFGDVVAFYRQELATRDFAPGGGSAIVGTDTEGQVCAWHTSDLVVRLSFWKIDEWVSRHPSQTPYPTVYDIQLIDERNATDLGECRYPTG